MASTNDEERPTVNYNNDDLSMDHLINKKGVVLGLIQHSRRDKSNGLEGIHPKIMTTLSDVITKPLTKLSDMSLLKSKLSRIKT